MSRRGAGLLLMGLGGLLVLVGLIGMLGASSGDPTTATTVAVAVETTTTTTATTTSAPATTSSPPTTVAAETTTTVAESTSTVPVFDEVAAVEEFVTDFITAIDRADTEFLYERLHPLVKEEFDEQVCRDFIDREILALEGYRATGSVEGPNDSQFADTPVTSYDVPVAFTFQGEDFEAMASYSLTEGAVRWFAVCR